MTWWRVGSRPATAARSATVLPAPTAPVTTPSADSTTQKRIRAIASACAWRANRSLAAMDLPNGVRARPKCAAHGAALTAAPRPGRGRGLARPEHQRPGARRAIRTRELHLAAGRHIRTGRKRARPYDGHGRHTASDPFSRSAQNEARRDPSRSGGRLKSCPARDREPADIAKEDGRAPDSDAQEIRPSTYV